MELWRMALIFALCVQWQLPLFAQSDPKVVLAQIQKQWATLPDKIKTLDCTIESEKWWPKESGYSDDGKKRIPPQDQTLKLTSKYQIDFNTDRFNMQRDLPRGNDATGYYEVYGILHAISDGRTYSSYLHTEAQRKAGDRKGYSEFPAGFGSVFGKRRLPHLSRIFPFCY